MMCALGWKPLRAVLAAGCVWLAGLGAAAPQAAQTGAISGRTVDENGNPGGQRIWTYQYVPVAGRMVSSGVVGEGTADAQGRFTISDLPPGLYSLPGVPGVYSLPGTSDLIRVEADGVSSGHTVHVRSDTVRTTVTGRVSGPYPASAGIYMGQRGKCFGHAEMAYDAPIARGGFFEFGGVRPGAYSICVGEVNTQRDIIYSWVDLDVPAQGVDNLVLRLTPRFGLTGRVTIDGLPAAGVKVRLWQPAFDSVWRSGQTDSQGDFALTEVCPAQYDLTVSAIPSNEYVTSVQLGEREVSGATLDLTGGDPMRPLLIGLKAR